MLEKIKIPKDNNPRSIIKAFEKRAYFDSQKKYENIDEYFSIVSKAYIQKKEFRKALEVGQNINNPSEEALLGLAGAAFEINAIPLALQYSKSVISRNPNNHRAYNMLGLSLMMDQGYLPAIQAFSVSNELLNNTPAMNNLASCYSAINKFDKAIEWYIKILEVSPDNSLTASNLMLTLHYSENYNKDLKERIRKILSDIYKKQGSKNKIKDINNRKLKLAFVSPDFRKHSVSYFFLPFLKEIDRRKYEIFLLSSVVDEDSITLTYRSLADHFININSKTDLETSKIVKDAKIDIIFDLCGHTSGNRLGIFSYNPAPISISWIGFPGKTANPNIDYFLVDRETNPEDDSKLIKLPASFLTFKGNELSKNKEKVDWQDCFVFGSFNNIRKISDRVISVWSRILKNCPHSKLLIKARQMNSLQGQQLIIDRFKNEGIGKDKLLFAGYAKDTAVHMDHYKSVDLALDSFPYNGTTTTCEVLTTGTPIISLIGDEHVSRVGLSLLSSLGLDSYLAENEEEYILKAMNFYKNGAERLWDIDERFSLCDLGNASLFCKEFENMIDNLVLKHRY